MKMGIPQLIYLFLVAFGVGVGVSRYGEKKNDSYDIVDVLIGPAITLGLLYWSGFFDAS